MTHVAASEDLRVHRWTPGSAQSTFLISPPGGSIPSQIFELLADPYTGHLFGAIGGSPGAPGDGGAVVRFDPSYRYLDVDTTFGSPRLGIP